jgi:flagellar hook-basal body complex protein FliE
MVQGIGKGALAREALLAALESSQRGTAAADTRPAADVRPAAAAADTAGVDFARSLEHGLEQVDQSTRTAQEMPEALMTGQVSDFHEIAVQLKSAELSFRFAMEIRNKLIDAYREVMRMSV